MYRKLFLPWLDASNVLENRPKDVSQALAFDINIVYRLLSLFICITVRVGCSQAKELTSLRANYKDILVKFILSVCRHPNCTNREAPAWYYKT